MNKILIVPGAFQTIKNYGNYNGLDIWLKSYSEEFPQADFYIGHSIGVNFTLSHYDLIKNSKFIFVNPLIKKVNLISLSANWIKFLFHEGIKWEKVTPISNWLFDFKRIFELLKVDAFGVMLKIPRDHIVVIKGNNDNYFCDKQSVNILKNNGFTVIEVEAGHDWNQNIAKTTESCINEQNF